MSPTRLLLSVPLSLCITFSSIAEDVPDPIRKDFNLSPFYTQHASATGLPVVASAKVSPYALKEAAYLIDHLLAHRPDVRKAMIDNRVRVSIMASTELTTDIPEHSDLTPKSYWDRRARGLGPTPQRPSISGGEENLLCFKGDPYRKENILIHEFAHAVHLMGVNTVDKTFDKRLRRAFDAAKAAGLWQNTYALSNDREYFAEGAQIWFDCNAPKGHEHNDVDTRERLKAYDPALAKLIEEVFGDTPWRYQRPDSPERLKDPQHLKGYDPTTAPTFAWPKNLPPLPRPATQPAKPKNAS
jgi:hypothetical protein